MGVWGVGGGGGKEETASLKCEKRGRAFLWETLSNTPPRLDDRGREPCHSFCASVGLTSLERSCCFSFVLLVFRHVFTHRRKNLFFCLTPWPFCEFRFVVVEINFTNSSEKNQNIPRFFNR